MFRRAIPLVVLVCLGVSKPGVTEKRDHATQPRGTGALTVRLSSPEGRPVARARILLTAAGRQSAGPNSRWEATTGSDGRCLFAGLPAGSYRVSASHPQYLTVEYGQRQVGLSGRQFDISEGTQASIALVAARGSAITGRVLDENGEPIQDVTVNAYRLVVDGESKRLEQVGGRSFPSNDIGEYRISTLPPGDVLVTAHYRAPASARGEAQAFGRTWYPGVADIAAAQWVRLQPGSDSYNISFALQPTVLSTVSGTVVSSRGEPAEGIQLSLVPVNGEWMSMGRLSAQTARGGTFAFSSVPPGDYWITGRRGGATSGSLEFVRTRVTVTGASVDGVRVELQPGVRIRIRLLGVSAGTSGAALALMPIAGMGQLAHGRLQDGVSAVLSAVPGKYFVSLRGLDESWIIDRVTADGRDVTYSGFQVDERGEVQLSVAVSQTGAQIFGTALGAAALSDYTVIVMREAQAERTAAADGVRSVRSDQFGRFSVNGLRPGRYVIAALDYTLPADLTDQNFAAWFSKNAETIVIGPGETKPLSIRFLSRG